MWSYFTSHTRSIRSGSHDRSLPALQRLWPPGMRAVRRCRRASRPLAPRMLVERAARAAAPAPRASSLRVGHRERRGDADVMQLARARRRARAAASPRASLPALVPAEAGDDAVGGARVLDLDHRALAGLVRRRRPAWRSRRRGPRLRSARATRRPARGRASSASGGSAARRRAEQPLEPRAPLALRRVAQIVAVDGEQIEGDERRRRLLRQLRRRATRPGAAAAAARRSRGRAAWRSRSRRRARSRRAASRGSASCSSGK